MQHRRSDADSVIHAAVETVDFHIGAAQSFIFFGNVFVQKQVSLTELQSLIFGVMAKRLPLFGGAFNHHGTVSGTHFSIAESGFDDPFDSSFRGFSGDVT